MFHQVTQMWHKAWSEETICQKKFKLHALTLSLTIWKEWFILSRDIKLYNVSTTSTVNFILWYLMYSKCLEQFLAHTGVNICHVNKWSRQYRCRKGIISSKFLHSLIRDYSSPLIWVHMPWLTIFLTFYELVHPEILRKIKRTGKFKLEKEKGIFIILWTERQFFRVECLR